MPPLETSRLIIRPFQLDDLQDIHRILDIELNEANTGTEGPQSRDGRKEWLQWSVMNYEELAKLYQPPYGDRAVVLKQSGELIGACGYAQVLLPLGLLPSFDTGSDAANRLNVCEMGLYYAFSPSQQRKGYATEAAQALVDYAFQQLQLRRIVATTSFDNVGSMGVMVKLGMRIERNPHSEPPYLQVVGVLDNPQIRH
jgi:RimJ/RimL family protein N-acetyltransferase